jgi:hypothetical protein
MNTNVQLMQMNTIVSVRLVILIKMNMNLNVRHAKELINLEVKV